MKEILQLLKQNARLSNAELAAMTDHTEAEVAEIIAKMERDGVIRGYSVIVDDELADRDMVSAYIECPLKKALYLLFQMPSLHLFHNIALLHNGKDIAPSPIDNQTNGKLSHHKGKDDRHPFKHIHLGFIHTGGLRRHFLLDIHGQPHQYRHHTQI